MSGLYFDALKDPLYSRAAGDARRRSAQSALLYVLTRFVTALAPVLSFTTEEAWQALPGDLRGDAESVFDTSFDVARHRGASRGRAGVVAAAARAARAGGRCEPSRATSKRSCGSPSRPTPTSGSRRSATTCAKRWSSRSSRWSRTSARTPMRTTACSFSSSRRPTARSACAAGSSGSSASIPRIRRSARSAPRSCGRSSVREPPARRLPETPATRRPRSRRALAPSAN